MTEMKKHTEASINLKAGFSGTCSRGAEVLKAGDPEKIEVEKAEHETGFVKQAQVKNIRAKKRMAAELERMGLSKEAIGRVLNLDVKGK